MIELWHPDHTPRLSEWARRWGVPLSPARLPKFGVIADDAIAIWLYKTDSTVGFIDGILGNPDVSARKRHVALLKAVKAIEEEADRSGIDLMFGFTPFQGVESVAKRLGWSVTYPQLAFVSKHGT